LILLADRLHRRRQARAQASHYRRQAAESGMRITIYGWST